jgi:hypothetical protein
MRDEPDKRGKGRTMAPVLCTILFHISESQRQTSVQRVSSQRDELWYHFTRFESREEPK